MKLAYTGPRSAQLPPKKRHESGMKAAAHRKPTGPTSTLHRPGCMQTMLPKALPIPLTESTFLFALPLTSPSPGESLKKVKKPWTMRVIGQDSEDNRHQCVLSALLPGPGPWTTFSCALSYDFPVSFLEFSFRFPWKSSKLE